MFKLVLILGLSMSGFFSEAAISKSSMSVKDIYLKILKNYESDNVKELKKYASKMYKKSPGSVYMDNTFYLLGRSQIRKKDYAGAVKTFSFLSSKFPHSKKIVSALFAKATIYKNLKLKGLSKKYYNLVIKRYPGSIEQKRASIEIKHL